MISTKHYLQSWALGAPIYDVKWVPYVLAHTQAFKYTELFKAFCWSVGLYRKSERKEIWKRDWIKSIT